jgi:hypothetical protein
VEGERARGSGAAGALNRWSAALSFCRSLSARRTSSRVVVFSGPKHCLAEKPTEPDSSPCFLSRGSFRLLLQFPFCLLILLRSLLFLPFVLILLAFVSHGVTPSFRGPSPSPHHGTAVPSVLAVDTLHCSRRPTACVSAAARLTTNPFWRGRVGYCLLPLPPGCKGRPPSAERA